MARRDQTLEKTAVLKVINALEKVGWKAYRVSDVEVPAAPYTTESLMEEIFSMDDCHVFFQKPGVGRGAWVYFVFGNEEDGSTVVCDHVVLNKHPEFEKAIEEAVDDHEKNVVAKLCKHQFEPDPTKDAEDVCVHCGLRV